MKISDLQFGVSVPKDRPEKPSTPENTSFEQLFSTVVHRFPERTALKDGERSLSFSELDTISAAIANFILEKAYAKEAVVGVLCQRGSLMLAAACGAIRAGAVYLPVDREGPLARQEAMLQPASLLITDRSGLREAEYFQYRNPRIRHLLCLDSPVFEDAIEKRTELGSVAFWEHVAQAGSDRAWKSYVDGEPIADKALASLAANVLEKAGVAEKRPRRTLDIGSGSGVVARALIDASEHYTAVDLARNELDRIELQPAKGGIKAHQMEAIDIRFLADDPFDLINLQGVVENFPGYNYLRQVLTNAVAKLADGGVIFIGSVPDLQQKDRFREVLRASALESGDVSGLMRFDASAELFVPQQFFTAWAAESGLPVEVAISRPNVDCEEIAAYRFDVVIRKKAAAAGGTGPTRFGTDHLYALPKRTLPLCTAEQAAYIVYTSGSTGTPKGVVVEHRHLLHILRALRDYSAGCEQIALFAPLSFDASIQQLAVSLMVGKPLLILSEDERRSPASFCEAVRGHDIDLCDMTPAFFTVLVEYLVAHHQCLPLKKLLIAGEVLRPDVVQKFYRIAGHEEVILYNVYGPTECTVDTSTYRIDYQNHQHFTTYPIGKALPGSCITIRDNCGRILPDSVTGEIWIAGGGVTRGYHNVDSAATFVMAEGRRWYRTGDYGFVQEGLVFYLGRKDQQVKIRGNRVELGEVEKAIAGFPGVRQVAVVAETFDAGEERSLAAYIVGDVDAEALKRYLEGVLPPYGVPGYFVPMVELPLSTNGKVDKKALPSVQAQKPVRGGRRPCGPLEEPLAAIWKKLLGFAVTDADANFFSLGGHSILAIRLIALIEKELELRLTLSELFAHPTIARLAGFFAGKTRMSDSPVIQLCHCPGGKNLFLFHPVGGSVFCYSDLANLLGHKFSVFAVEGAGFSPERTALNTELYGVEDLADYYLGEILKVAADNIIFGGWSFGGLLAYEAACRYEKMGQDAGAVVVLDSVADNGRAKQDAGKDEIDLLKSRLQGGLAFDEAKLRSLPRAEKLKYLVECGEQTGLLPVGFSCVQMENLLQTYRGNAIAAARYERPTPSDKQILLVRALEMSESSRSFVDDPYQGWNKFLKEENITLRWTEGTHETMLSPGLVKNVAPLILEYLDHV